MPTDKNNKTADQPVHSTLGFMGEITASVTHELSNVIGTIEQIAGLIGDLAETDDIRKALECQT